MGSIGGNGPNGGYASLCLRNNCRSTYQILLMTGFPSSEIRKEADRAQVFRFLEKPFGLDEVSAAIAAATR